METRTLQDAIIANRARMMPGKQFVVFIACREQIILHAHASHDIADCIRADAQKTIDRYPNGTIQLATTCSFPAWFTRHDVERSIKGNHDLPILWA